QAAYPELSSPPVSISLGPLALGYLLSVGGSGYFRVGAAGPLLDSGRLHRVAGAPEFSYSAYVLYATQQRGDVMDRVRDGLRAVAAGIKSPEVPAHKTVVGR